MRTFDFDRLEFETFLRESCKIGNRKDEIEQGKLFSAFVRWWGDSENKHWITRQMFLALANATFKKGKRSYHKTYKGVSLKEDGEQ